MERQFDSSRMTNSKLCSECNDVCCERCGCTYFPEDFKFKINFENLKSEIDKGFIAIDAINGLVTPYLKILDRPVYYLRVRNVNDNTPIGIGKRGRCILLKQICDLTFEERPSGGKYYIPFDGKDGCYALYTDQDIVNLWLPYQDVLILLLEHYKKIGR